MDRAISSSQISSAFVTGATGLLGNHLVRLLVERGVHVQALARSPQKAEQQFAGLPVEVVIGDMNDIPRFAGKLRGVDVLFHTAAYFRDSYKGGSHRKALLDTNVRGTAEILSQAYSAGVRRVVHTSSVNVLAGPEGALIDERMSRAVEDVDDYSLSKILSDREVVRFLQGHRDMSIAMVLPGDGQIIARLKIHPEPCRGAEINCQAKGGVGGHAPASRDDLGQAIGRHIQIAGQLGDRQVPGGDFLTENFTGMDRRCDQINDSR